RARAADPPLAAQGRVGLSAVSLARAALSRLDRRVMKYSAVFRCLAGCPGEYPLTRAIYRCPTCHGLLDVSHDLAALKDRSAASWMKLFDERYKRTHWPYGSGVWGKREWVAPEVPDDTIVSMDEGGTNLFWAERYGRSIG